MFLRLLLIQFKHYFVFLRLYFYQISIYHFLPFLYHFNPCFYFYFIHDFAAFMFELNHWKNLIELLILLTNFLCWFQRNNRDRNLAWSILDFRFIHYNSCGSLCLHDHRGRDCLCLNTRASVHFRQVNGNTEGQLQISCCLYYRDLQLG